MLKAGTVQFEEGDIKQFRTPQPGTIRCKGSICEVAYYMAVPGAGRILEQQAFMVKAIIGHLPVTKLQIDVVRGTPQGPNASAPAEEETDPGLPLLRTVCSWAPGAKSTPDPFELMTDICTSSRPGNTGEYQKSAGRVHLPAGAPEYQPG